MICQVCTSTWNVAYHHHPRRSAGIQRDPHPGSPGAFSGWQVEVEDPRRKIALCGLCHAAIHDRRLLLDRYRDGLHFTLDKVEESPSARDSDLVMDITREPPGLAWKQDYQGDNIDDYFREVIEENRGNVEAIVTRTKGFLPYAAAEHWEPLVVEIAELGTRQLDRLRTAMRVIYYDTQTFRWGQDGKPISDEARKKLVAEGFGVSVTTVKDDLKIVDVQGLTAMLKDDRPRSAILQEARGSRQSSDDSEPECPDGPGGKHHWKITGRKCLICGAEK